MNVLSMHALVGAYSQDGHEWTDELNQVLESNCRYATQYIQDHFPGCHVSLPQGTYMLSDPYASRCPNGVSIAFV